MILLVFFFFQKSHKIPFVYRIQEFMDQNEENKKMQKHPPNISSEENKFKIAFFISLSNRKFSTIYLALNQKYFKNDTKKIFFR